MSYTPSQQVLERYADVLVNFALGGGAGVKRGDVVRIVAHEAAKPLYVELHRAVWRAGAHAIGAATCPTTTAASTSRATSTSSRATSRSTSSPATYMRGLVDQMDHQVAVHQRQRHARARGHRPGADHAPRPLDEAVPWTGAREKENAGRFTLDARPLRHARRWRPRRGSREEEYWQQIIERLLPRRGGPDRALARGERRRSATTSSGSTRCRSTACTSSARTSTCA